ncbi:hypothetical protein LSTR_LSTR003088 [Laodelphax striatellus]|uniref:Uncharacterized protein n=1 Tax=Laodelphax striatellus TaxID=195883 RepID=A0A482WVQ6_LAOST|nr:hypothetical protein LSTR_LSTR003088 [Laodelphax striatellus]
MVLPPGEADMGEPAEEAKGMEAVKEEPDALKNFEIDDEMETMLEDLEGLIFDFIDPNVQGVEFDEESDDDCVALDEQNRNDESDREEDEEGEEEDQEVVENEEEEAAENDEEEEEEVAENEEEEVEVAENEEEEEVEVAENEEEEEQQQENVEEDDQVEQEAVQSGEEQEEDEIVAGENDEENERGELSEGEIHDEPEEEVNNEKEAVVEEEVNSVLKGDNYFRNSKDVDVENDRAKIVDTCEYVVKEAVKRNLVKETKNSHKEKISCQQSKTCTENEVYYKQFINKEQSLPNKKTDQYSQKSTNLSIDGSKPEKRSSTVELPKVVDKCDKQAKNVCDEQNNVEARRGSVTENLFQTDFGVQTTFELSMLSKKDLEDDVDLYGDLPDNLPEKSFESGECTSSDDDEAVNALKQDKMFNHKIDNMMNNFGDGVGRRDSSSQPPSENDKLCNSKKKEQIIKLLYEKIKSVGENKIVQEMLSKKLIDDDSKEKLLEIIRYCVEKRKEKIRMKKLKKRAHQLKVTKNNTFLEALKHKSEVSSKQEKRSKTRTISPIVVGSKVTKRVIVDCNSVNLKSKTVDYDLRQLIEKKQNLVKQKDSSHKEKKSSKTSTRCKKKGCERRNCKKHRSKEEKKLRKSEREKRKIEMLLRRREKLKRQFLEEEKKKKKIEAVASTFRHENDVERQKKIELENRIKEKIALVFKKRDLKQAAAAEVSRSETCLKKELKQDRPTRISSVRSREGSYSSDCSRKSTAHSNKTVVKGPAAESFSGLYEALGKSKKLSAKEVTRVSNEGDKDKIAMKNDDDGELFPTISSIISKEIDLDSDIPSPPPPPIISTLEEDEEEVRVEHVSRRDQHLQAAMKNKSPERVANQPQAAVPFRRSRSPIRINENNRTKLKSRSRSPLKHWKPVTSKPEAIVAPRRRSPSPTDRYSCNRARSGRATEPQLTATRARDPSQTLWRRRSRDKRSANVVYSSPRSPSPESPPRHATTSRLSEIRRKQKEDFEEAIRQWRETQEKKKPEPTVFNENVYADTPLSGNEPQPTFPPFNCMANQFVHNQSFFQHPPPQMVSPYHMSVPDTPMSQVYAPSAMLGGPAMTHADMAYHGHDTNIMQAPAAQNTSGQQVATISTADNGMILGQSSGGIITTINENDPQGLSKSTQCHHHSDAQAPFNNPSDEGFPIYNAQPNSAFPPRHPEMGTDPSDGNLNTTMGFARFPPPTHHPPFKVVHHPKFPYPIPVPYIEPPAPPTTGPIIPFLRPPPNLNQLPPSQPPLPTTEPPPLFNPPLPSSPAPSTVCSSPVRPSSPAVSECGSVRSVSSRKKIGHDIMNVIDLIKGKLEQGEQSESPLRNKSFTINYVKDIISSVRKALAPKKLQMETPETSESPKSPGPEERKSEDKPAKPEVRKSENESATPEERKLRIEFKKPVVKKAITHEIAPEFLKEMQEDEEEEEGEIVDPKPKPDREAVMQKKIKVLEILNDLNSKISTKENSKDHKSLSSSDRKVDGNKVKLPEKSREINISQTKDRILSLKEIGDQSSTVEKYHSSTFPATSSGRKLQDKSNTAPRRISTESKSKSSSEKADICHKDDIQERKSFQKTSLDYQSSTKQLSSVAAEPERSKLFDYEPDVSIANESMDIVQESATSKKNSPGKDERKCVGQIVFCKSFKDSKAKSEYEKEASTLYKRRSRFSDAPMDPIKESHHRSENKSGTESKLSDKTVVVNVQQKSVPQISETRVESKTDSLEKSTAKEKLSTLDERKQDENRTVKDQQVDSGKNESPASKIRREQIQKHLKRELAHAKAACRASSVDKLKNSKSDNQAQEKSSVARDSQVPTKEQLSSTTESKPASKSLETVDVQKSVSKNEGILLKSENSQLTASSKDSTTDGTDLTSNKKPQNTLHVRSESSTSNDNSTNNSKAKFPHADPRLNKVNIVQTSKVAHTVVLDPRLNRDPRARSQSTENRNVDIPHTTVSDPRLNRHLHSETNKNFEPCKTSVLDPRLNRTKNVEVGKSAEMPQTSIADPILSKTHHSEVVKNVELLPNPSNTPNLNREHSVEVDRNSEISQKTEINVETFEQRTSLSEVASKKTNSKPNLKSLTLRVMNELDPVLRDFGNTADNLDEDEASEFDEIKGDSTLLREEKRIEKEKSTETTSITVSKSQLLETSGPCVVEKCSETDSQNLKLKPSIDSQNAGDLTLNKVNNVQTNKNIEAPQTVMLDPSLSRDPTEHSEQSRIPQKSEQDHPKQQPQSHLEKSQNNTELDKKINPQDKINEVKENGMKSVKSDLFEPLFQKNKRRIAHEQAKNIERKLVKDDSSRSTDQEHKKMISPNSVAKNQAKESVKKPEKDRRSSLETISNKEKPCSTKKETQKDAKLDSTTDKRNKQSSTSGSTKLKSTTESKSESKNVPSNSKKTEGCGQNVVKEKRDPIIQSKAASKVDSKDTKIDKSAISNEEHGKSTKHRRSSYESVTSTSISAQKNSGTLSDAASKQRRVSLDSGAEKGEKKIVIKDADSGTGKHDNPAKKISLEKLPPKSSKSVDPKTTGTVSNVKEVTAENQEGKKIKPDKSPAHQPSSSKFVVSNLSNKELTNMEPPKVKDRRSSVIEISSSDDESLKNTSVSKKGNQSSRDAFKKTKHKRSDCDSTKSSRDHHVHKNISSSKGSELIQKKIISEVDILKRQLESDSSDDEADFMQKKKKPVESLLTFAAKKHRADKVRENISIKKAAVCGGTKEVTPRKDESENDFIQKKKKHVDSLSTSHETRKVGSKKVLENIPITKAAVSENTKELIDNSDESENVLFRNINDSDKSTKKLVAKKGEVINESSTTEEIAARKVVHEKDQENISIKETVVCESTKEVTSKKDESENVINERDKSLKKVVGKKVVALNESLTTKKTEVSPKLQDKAEAAGEVDEVDQSSLNVTNKTALESDNSQGEEVGEINKSKTINTIETSEESVPPKKINNVEKSNEIVHKSVESSVIEGGTKMKELTLSNEDFNFEVDAPNDVKNIPNTRKVKKLGKLKNKFLKIGVDLFPDQESNDSSDSFKNLITNICGTLEENSDSPAVAELAIKNCEDASLVVAESLKMLGSFVEVAQSVFRERRRICVDYFEVTDDIQLIQHISDVKKSKFNKNKLNRGVRGNRTDKDGVDNHSLVSSDSYDVFEFSEDLPAAISDRRSLPSEIIRHNKSHLENDKTLEKDSNTELSSSDNLPSSSSAQESPLEINTVQSSTVEKASAVCDAEIPTQNIEDSGGKGDNKTESSSEIIAQESVYEKLLKDLDEIEVIKKSVSNVCNKNKIDKLSVERAEKIENSTDVIRSAENCNETSNQTVDKVSNSSEKTVGTKCFDVTVSNDDNKIESSSEVVVGKKGFNKFSAQEVGIIESPAGVVISMKHNETSTQNMNETASSSDKKISTSSGTFQVNSNSTCQPEKPVIKSKISKKFKKRAARYQANYAFKITTADESIKNRKSSLVENLSTDDVNKLCTRDDSTGNREVSNETSSIIVNPDCSLVSNDVIDISSIDNSTLKTKNKSKKRASLLEDVSGEPLPKKKRKLKSHSGKLEAAVCDDIEENTEDGNIRVTRARKLGGKVVEDETSSVIDDDSQETEGVGNRVKRGSSTVGSVRSDEIENSNVLEGCSQETEINSRVTRKRKSEGAPVEVDKLHVVEEDEEEGMNTRVTRARKSVATSARSDETESSNVLLENDSQEELITRVTRARKSLAESDTSSVPGEDSQEAEELNTRVTRKRKLVGETSKELQHDSQETEEFNTKVPRARKSVGTSPRIKEVEETRCVRMSKVDDDSNKCGDEFGDNKNERDNKNEIDNKKERAKDVEEEGCKKRLRSSLKILNKEETNSNPEQFWIKLCQAFNKSSRSVGTNVTEVRGKLIGFESFESSYHSPEELDLDNTLARLLMLKQQRDAQKL